MRDFVQTRRGLNAPQASLPISFRNNNQGKDDSLAAIMERRRQIADSEQTIDSGDIVGKTTFAPRSNRMKKRDSMGSGTDLNVNSEHTPTISVVTPTGGGTLNELQMAMSKRRTKVEDTTLEIVSPRRLRLAGPSPNNHQTISPTLQEKLQKQLRRAQPSSPNSKSPSKVLLSALPSPIHTSPRQRSQESVDGDDRSR
jgi:hypothetical protein